jgi:energy-coupling factor transporter transmembrane protein EcfT
MFNQIFSKKVVVPFFQFVGIIAIFTFIVFPGLTAADTIVNIFSAIIGFFTMLALFYFVTNWFQKDELTDEQIKAKLESELGPVIDEMAKEVLAKPTKKSNPKQFDGIKSDEPFIKTRTKPKTEKVMGEYQLNNKEKVRKSVTKNKK